LRTTLLNNEVVAVYTGIGKNGLFRGKGDDQDGGADPGESL